MKITVQPAKGVLLASAFGLAYGFADTVGIFRLYFGAYFSKNKK